MDKQGSQSGRYSLVPRTLIFITHKNEILLLRGAANKRLWANQYNGIGGHVEPGEDVMSAARRELQEETGLAPIDLRLSGVVTIDTGSSPGILLFVYRGEYPAELNGQLIDSPEGSLEWIDQAALSSLPLVEDLHILLPVVLAAVPGDQPFSGHYSYNREGKLQITFAG